MTGLYLTIAAKAEIAYEADRILCRRFGLTVPPPWGLLDRDGRNELIDLVLEAELRSHIPVGGARRYIAASTADVREHLTDAIMDGLDFRRGPA